MEKLPERYATDIGRRKQWLVRSLGRDELLSAAAEALRRAEDDHLVPNVLAEDEKMDRIALFLAAAEEAAAVVLAGVIDNTPVEESTVSLMHDCARAASVEARTLREIVDAA